MRRKKDPRDQYLIEDKSGVYIVRVVLPTFMRSHFGNRTAFMRSCSTKDIRVARVFRDAVMIEFNRLRETLRPKQEDRLDDVVQELKQLREHVASAGVSAVVEVKVCPGLSELADLYLRKYQEDKKVGTLLKVTRSVASFTSYYKRKDFKLYEINRTMVTNFLEDARKEYAAQTVAGWLNSLSQLVMFAQDRYHDAPKENVFAGHRLDVKNSRQSYEPFTEDEIARVYADLEVEMKAVTKIALYSGMRLNEICSLRVCHIVTSEDGVMCFDIVAGKTKNAVRKVPVHKELISLVLSLRESHHNGFLFRRASLTNRTDGKRSTWHTQQFTRAKRKVLGEEGTELKVFHSLRGMAISQWDQNKIPEDRIALLAGHERGQTESFRTYSQGAKMKELEEIVNLLSYPMIEGL